MELHKIVYRHKHTKAIELINALNKLASNITMTAEIVLKRKRMR